MSQKSDYHILCAVQFDHLEIVVELVGGAPPAGADRLDTRLAGSLMMPGPNEGGKS